MQTGIQTKHLGNYSNDPVLPLKLQDMGTLLKWVGELSSSLPCLVCFVFLLTFLFIILSPVSSEWEWEEEEALSGTGVRLLSWWLLLSHLRKTPASNTSSTEHRRQLLQGSDLILYRVSSCSTNIAQNNIPHTAAVPFTPVNLLPGYRPAS